MRKYLNKIVSYFSGLINGTMNMWGGKISIWGPIIDEAIGINYRRSIFTDEPKKETKCEPDGTERPVSEIVQEQKGKRPRDRPRKIQSGVEYKANE